MLSRKQMRATNPAVCHIAMNGTPVLACPTDEGARKMLAFYQRNFPKYKWSIVPVAPSAVEKKNPALLVLSNPRRVARNPCGSNVAKAKNAYEKFHMVAPNTQNKAEVPNGWPTAYMTIGWATLFEGKGPDGKKYTRRYPSGRVKLCTTGDMKDVFLFGPSLGILSGKAERVDYDVPSHSGRNKWAKKWWHPTDSHPAVTADRSGRAARMHGPGLKVNVRGIIG